MKNYIYIFGIVLIVITVVIFTFSSSSNNIPTGDSSIDQVFNTEKEMQEVNLGMKNYNYYPDIIKVKAGQPVALTLDNSVKGCLRSFTVKELGVSKFSKSPSEKITFTPIKKGTFAFACSMGMGYGKLIVE